MTFFTRLWTAAKIWQSARTNAKTPGAVTWLPLLSLIYLLSPIDLAPDILPLLGQMDDIGVIIVLCTLAFRLIPKDLKQKFGGDVIDVEPAAKR